MAYGAYGAVTRRAASHAESREVDLGQVAVLPGLVNAHTHLELSYLRDEVPPASQFVTWIRGVMKARRERPDPGGRATVGQLSARDERGNAPACHASHGAGQRS